MTRLYQSPSEMDSNKIECEWCRRTFSKKANLVKHQKYAKSCITIQKTTEKEQCKYCRTYFLISKTQEHILECSSRYQKLEYDFLMSKNECKELSNKLDSMTSKLELSNNKIRDLELELSESKGYIKGVEKNKSNNNINSNNTNSNNTYIKITNIVTAHIKPFDVDLIKNNIDDYTYKLFLKGIEGLAKFLLPLMKVEYEGITERSYVCSDIERKSCHRLTKNKNSRNESDQVDNSEQQNCPLWIKDPKARYLNAILNELRKKSNFHWAALTCEVNDYERNTMKKQSPEEICYANSSDSEDHDPEFKQWHYLHEGKRHNEIRALWKSFVNSRPKCDAEIEGIDAEFQELKSKNTDVYIDKIPKSPKKNKIQTKEEINIKESQKLINKSIKNIVEKRISQINPEEELTKKVLPHISEIANYEGHLSSEDISEINRRYKLEELKKKQYSHLGSDPVNKMNTIRPMYRGIIGNPGDSSRDKLMTKLCKLILSEIAI